MRNSLCWILEIGRFNDHVRIVGQVFDVQGCRNHPFVGRDSQEERDEKGANHQADRINYVLYKLKMELKIETIC